MRFQSPFEKMVQQVIPQEISAMSDSIKSAYYNLESAGGQLGKKSKGKIQGRICS